MTYRTDRRQFLRVAAGAATAAGLRCAPSPAPEPTGTAQEPWFRISLAQWSLHRALGRGELDTLAFITAARQDYGLEAVEYVNIFFREQAEDLAYLRQMQERCDAEGVRSVLIMCDGEGRLGDPDDGARAQAVANHHKWVHAARYLGCHAIRVNAGSEGSPEEQSRLVADGLHQLASFAASLQIAVLVENHGSGVSSDAAWIAATIRRADHLALGTLPDFGNWDLGEGKRYDMYRGLEEMMPLARAVSAKSHDFDEAGNETTKDYLRLLRIVRDAGYRGFVGIEYEGERLAEADGIRRTRALLERCRAELASDA